MTIPIEVCYFKRPVMDTADYLALFNQVGLKTETFVGYKDQDDDGQHPILCFVCSKKK